MHRSLAPDPPGWVAPDADLLAIAGKLQQHAARILTRSVAALPLDRSLLALGLDSLSAVELRQAIEDDLGVEVSLSWLLDGASLQELAALLPEQPAPPSDPPVMGRDGDASECPAAGPEETETALSYAQRALWFLQRLAPGSAAYHIAVAVSIDGELDLTALARSLQAVADRHPALRTTFHARGAGGAPGPVQRVHPSMPVGFTCEEAAGCGPAELARRCREAAAKPFALEAGPLLRVTVLRRGPREHLMVLTLHHLVADFWSLALVHAELARFYEAGGPQDEAGGPPDEEAGGPPGGAATSRPAPAPAACYGDFVRWQAARIAGAAGERLWQAWREALAGPLPDLDLPADRLRPPVRSDRGLLRGRQVAPPLADRLRALGLAGGATLFTTLYAAFSLLLHRVTGQDDLLVGTPVTGRPRPEMADVVGCFVNTVVLRATAADFAGRPSFRELLARLRRRTLAAFEHQDLPFALVVERLQPQRDPARPPIFQVLFALQQARRPQQQALAVAALGVAGAEIPFGRLRLRSLADTERPSQLDLALQMAQDGDSLAAALHGSADLFDAVTVERVLDRLLVLLAAVAAGPDLPVDELQLLSMPERQQLLVAWNDTAVERAAEPLLDQLFTAQAERTPHRVAVTMQGEALTYRALDQRANQLAHRLLRLGLRPEAPVGIYAERSPATLVGLLAVLKAGGAYLPLDPAYPRQRVRTMLEDSGTRLVLTEQRLRSDLAGWSGTLLRLDADGPPAAGADAGALCRPPGAAGPESLAYLIYTSGSTGRPKGVEVCHGGVTNFLISMARVPGMDDSDVLVSVTSLCFDIAALELFLPLIVGARVVLASREAAADGARLRQALGVANATVLQATPATWRLLLGAGWNGHPRLRALCGGEALPGDLANALLERAAAVWNLYGPTETTIWSAAARLAPGPGPVPIGRPIDNTRLYVVDGAGQPVPAGVAGELLIGGQGVARGYHGRPELTAERFVPDPWSVPGARLYRTGDLARWRRDGALECLGRLDQQVKVRGFRIELGEIEAALRGLPDVREAVVVARPDSSSGRRLVACVVPAAGSAFDPGTLRARLAAILPEAFVPSRFLALESLPLTPNGKLDRHRLLDPADEPPRLAAPAAQPRSDLERRIAAIWQRVLGVAAAGRDDNFFDLGGHSLLLAEVQVRLQEELGHELSMVELVRHPTVAALAHRLTAGGGAATVAAPAGGPRRPPLPGGEGGRAIAVIGRAGRFPGAATVDELWVRLRGGEECVERLRDEELRAAGVPPALLADPRYVRAAGVMAGADLFDAAFFGFSPREAELMDPQHRIFLECAWHALEDAGYDSRRYPGRIGVYAGVGVNTYLHHAGLDREGGALSERYQAFVANDKDFVPSRVSYELGLTGPSVDVQTACSSSLVAVHLACQALLTGDCDMALAGGVSIRVPLHAGYLYEEGGIASPDGHCRAFDARAAGTVFGSGAGIVVLKPLAQALSDGDEVHAVIRGTAINNDGGHKLGFTAPSVEGQARAIAAALAAAGLAPDDISYVEAHGTGTPLGDPIELAALHQVFRHGAAARRRQACALGSVKTNLGHLDTAAGICGLLKTVEALRHGELPPSLHCTEPNPKLNLDDGPFFVNTELRPWPAADGPRRAGVSSFGIGGTNAHAVLEEAPPVPSPSPPPAPVRTRPAELLLLSARSAQALDVLSRGLAAHLRAHPEADLAAVAHTLRIGRRQLSNRRILVCRELDDAAAALAGTDPSRLRDAVVERADRPVVFLFPGQGAQHPRMGRGLYETEPCFRAEVDACSELLRPHLGLDLRRELYPDQEQEGAAGRLTETWLAQPALFAVEYALARLWLSWGVQPQAMIGHSLGEYVAACLAGVLSLPDALALVAVRGRMMQELPAGAMLGVELAEAEIVARLSPDLSLAAANGPADCVVSGPVPAIERLADELARAGVRLRRLHTSHAFHSPMMDPVVEPFAAEVAKLRLRPPALPYVSNLSGSWVTADEAMDPACWGSHLRRTVRFGAGLATLLDEPDRVLLEVGPGQVLSGLARRQGGDRAVVSSMRHPREPRADSEALVGAAGRLWLAGAAIDWERFAAGRGPVRRVSLPTYPFAGQRFWLQVPIAPAASPEPAGEGALVRPGKLPDLADWTWLPVWREEPLPLPDGRQHADGPPAGPWLILLHGGEGREDLVRRLAQRLAAASSGRTTTVEIAAAPDGDGAGTVPAAGGDEPRVMGAAGPHGLARLGDDAFALDPCRPESYVALVQELQAAGRLPRGVLHAWNCTPPAPPGAPAASDEDAGAAAVDAARTLAFDSLVFLLQALARAGATTALRVAVLSNGLHAVAGNPPEGALQPAKALLLGAVRVIPQEYPGVACRAIDVTPDPAGAEDDTLVAQLLDELDHGWLPPPAAEPGPAAAGSPVVALRDGQRFVRGFERRRLPAAAAPAPRIRRDGVYLITGGLGGIGLTLARSLAEAAPVKLVLTGRTAALPERSLRPRGDAGLAAAASPRPATADAPPRGALAAVAALEDMGAEVLALAADVTDAVAMAAAVDAAERRFGPLNGVIHAAGVPGGGVVQLETPAAAERVLAPKVRGTLVLDRLLRERSLDFFLLCSSITAVAGGFGQGDYCAANAFCDAFARAASRRYARRGTLAMAIGWDRWEVVGMAAAAATGGPARGEEKHGFATGHPLLGRCVAATAEREVYSVRLGPDRHWVLSEHLVAGVPTVPGTTFLEMARAAFARRAGAEPAAIEIRDVIFPAPLSVPPGQVREVRTVLEAETAAAPGAESSQGVAGRGFRVLSRTVAADEPAPWQEHARGWIGAGEAETPAAVHDVAALLRACAGSEITAPPPPVAPPPDLAPPAVADVAGGLSAAGAAGGLPATAELIATGPRWQSLRQLRLGAGQSFAELRLGDEHAADLAQTPLHPALLDLATGAVRLSVGGAYLPLAYQRLRLRGQLPVHCYSHLRMHRGHGQAGDSHDVLTCDVSVLDERGTAVLEIEGFSMKRVGEAALAQLRAAVAEPAVAELAVAEPGAAGHGTAGPASRDTAGPAGPARALPRPGEGITPAEGAELFRRLLGLPPGSAPNVLVATSGLPQTLAAADELSRAAAAGEAGLPGGAAPGPPAHARPELSTAYAPPSGDLERQVAAAWQRVLGIAEVGVHDNFFELGGTSLSAIQLIAELRRDLGREIPSVSLFEAPTISALVSYLGQAGGAGALAERGRSRADKKRQALARQGPRPARRPARPLEVEMDAR